MLFNFFNYLHSIRENDVNDYFNGYSTFIMTNKDLKDNILYHRMNFLISYYNKNGNKSDYINYYVKNFKDDYFSKAFLPKIPEKKIIDIIDNCDSDVKDHYKFLLSKRPIEPEPDYEEIDKKFYLEEEEKKNKELEIDYNYDDYEDDYYEEEYYEDEYYDDEYYNEEYY